MRRVLALLSLTACLGDPGPGPREIGAPADLSRTECDARARAARDACVADCTSAASSGARVVACQADADRSLRASSQALVGLGMGARASIVVPFEVCLGQTLVSSCADDTARARTLAAGLGVGGALLLDAWTAAGQGLGCDTAKALVRAECVRERKLWAQAHAMSSIPAEHDAGVQLAMAIGVYEVQAADWLTARRACSAGAQACVDDCPAGLGATGWLDCRWQCPATVGDTCTPPGDDRACGQVDHSFAWDSLYACECSADTAACRAPR